MMKKIKSALVSVYHKDRLEAIIQLLKAHDVSIYSTGGTQRFIEELGVQTVDVESLTTYPPVFGGRVKTLHPRIFGGILFRRGHHGDTAEAARFDIPAIDLVIVDLYPFEDTVASDASFEDVIEKIDIGGISLVRAAAKNHKDVLVVSSREQYNDVLNLLKDQDCQTSEADRLRFAVKAFDISSHYDTAIYNHLNSVQEADRQERHYKASMREGLVLRYGENPHQKGVFYGKLHELFKQLHGKALSYNNLVDVDAAVALMEEFPAVEGPAFAILKHNNACGAAKGSDCLEAYQKALQGDPVSAFGGVLISNMPIDMPAAEEIHKLFCEVLIAPDFDPPALELLKGKKNRILLKQQPAAMPQMLYKTLLNGVIAQEKDSKTETAEDLKPVTKRQPTAEEVRALLFANKLVKHTKSNTIVLSDGSQLFASGVGQTSRVDALKQAIHKAKAFGFDLSKAVMASDAFFPFPDCVEIASAEGIKAVIQPGGSVRDQESVDYCDAHGMAMVVTGVRHFKH